MRFMQILAVLPAVFLAANARCYKEVAREPTWDQFGPQSKQLAYKFVDELCKPGPEGLLGEYFHATGFPIGYKCLEVSMIDDKNNTVERMKFEFEVALSGTEMNRATLEERMCRQGFNNEIGGCDYGGDNEFVHDFGGLEWRFR
jgi:hypothetical protein